MPLGPQKREIYDSCENCDSGYIDPMIKLLVLVVTVIGIAAAFGCALFGHSWTPPS